MEKSPERSEVTDALGAIVAGVVSIIPFAGGPLAELVHYGLSRAYEGRLQQWLETLTDVVTELESSGWTRRP